MDKLATRRKTMKIKKIKKGGIKKENLNAKEEMESIFDKLKNSKSEGKQISKNDKSEVKNKLIRSAKRTKNELKEKRKKVKRETEDGIRIYSEKELKIGEGGNTSQCPFDCDCCF